MSKFSNLIEKIGTDKVLHFFVCAFVANRASALIYNHIVDKHTFLTAFVSWFGGVLVAYAIGYIKEWLDNMQEGNTFDYKDLLADLIGGAFGALWVWEFVI